VYFPSHLSRNYSQSRLIGNLARFADFALGVLGILLASSRLMKRHALTALLAVALLSGCPKKDEPKAGTKGKDPTKDQSEDQAFQSFTGRLRMAVTRHDVQMLSSLMAPDFGYRWDAAPHGETPFSYWDQHRLWGELNELLKTRWVPYESFMVVPPQMAEEQNYHGYRAGVRMVNGSWRFAYFVPEQPVSNELPPVPPAPSASIAPDSLL
jgi:hypothetical protein